MTILESMIKTVLERLKPTLASETWESRRRYFDQMQRCAAKHGIWEPCQELYDAFIAEDNGSPERRELHIRCVRLIDDLAGTKAKDSRGVMFNEPPMPNEADVINLFRNISFPIPSGVPIDALIVKAEIELRGLQHSDSTIGQYKHVWMEIRRYCYDAGVTEYDENLVHLFIEETNRQYQRSFIKKWKLRMNRYAAHVLLEVAYTGQFDWGLINRNMEGRSEINVICSRYLDSLRHRNLSNSTIGLHNYVFSRTMTFIGVKTQYGLLTLTPDIIQQAVGKFAETCSRRSMSTIIPVLRSLLRYLHSTGLTVADYSGAIMSSFASRGSVVPYLSKADQEKLLCRLEIETERTKAIILLAMRLGLRDCDIRSLTFQQIDWQNDKIRLNQKKTGGPQVLPLLPDIGNALMGYIIG